MVLEADFWVFELPDGHHVEVFGEGYPGSSISVRPGRVTPLLTPGISRRTLGHADAAMTAHYTHIEAEAHKAAAEVVAKLVESASS